MQVQGLRVPDVYLVEGFGRHLISTVALHQLYACHQHVDEMQVLQLQYLAGRLQILLCL